jgi:hypothetical protein
MNKALQYVSSQSYVFFLNASDVFISNDSLHSLESNLKIANLPLWGCATHEEIAIDGSNWVCKLVSPPSASNQLHAFGYRSHQAVVMKAEFIRNLGGFDESFKIAADWDLIVRALIVSEPAVWDMGIARFELGGFSSKYLLEAHLELLELRRKYLNYNFFQTILDHVWAGIYLRQFGYSNFASVILKFFRILDFQNLNYTNNKKPLISIQIRGESAKSLLFRKSALLVKVKVRYQILKYRLKYVILGFLYQKLDIQFYESKDIG